MTMVTKVIGGCVSSQRLEIVFPNPPAKDGKQTAVSVNWNKYIQSYQNGNILF